MEFIDLKAQYAKLKDKIDNNIKNVISNAHFISGPEVNELEEKLAKYVGRKYCVTCGNGTDALTIAMRVLDVKKGDAVFVPTFTFYSTSEVVSLATSSFGRTLTSNSFSIIFSFSIRIKNYKKSLTKN